MKAIDYVRDGLERDGKDGLYNENGECACKLSDLAPCSEMSMNCIGGYITKGEPNWEIAADKPEPECDKCGDTGKVRIRIGFNVTSYYHWVNCTCPAGDKLREDG